MRRLHLTTTIAASVDRVWRALCDPAEVIQWDTDVAEALDTPPDYPRPGQRVRWRLRSGDVLIDEPQEVLPNRALRTLLTNGAIHIDEVYTLYPDGDTITRIDADVEVAVAVPLLGGLLEHTAVPSQTRRAFAASLANLKRHCEASP
jgi:hypothetical protein